MSANGELFIQGNLSETASDSGMLDLHKEQLIVPDSYYDIWREQEIPRTKAIKIEDADTGEPLGELTYSGKFIWDEDGYHEFMVESIERDGVTKWVSEETSKGDWMQVLMPIINEMKDGEPTLDQESVDWMMTTIRAKVEFQVGLITKEEYELIIWDTER